MIRIGKSICHKWVKIKQQESTLKFLNLRTHNNFAVNTLKFELIGCGMVFCLQWMLDEKQTLKTLTRLLLKEQSDLGLHCLLRSVCPKT